MQPILVLHPRPSRIKRLVINNRAIIIHEKACKIFSNALLSNPFTPADVQSANFERSSLHVSSTSICGTVPRKDRGNRVPRFAIQRARAQCEEADENANEKTWELR